MNSSPIVLVIEDEDRLRRNFERFLARRGYAAHGARDGEEGLSLVERLRPRVVLVDFHLPRVDGIEVLRAIRTRHPRMPVIVMSGHHGSSVHDLAIAASAFAFLAKPFPLAQLATVVAEAVLLSSKLHELARSRVG